MAESVTRAYDTDFRVASESVNGGNSITFQYDPDSLLTGVGAVTLTRDPQHGLLTGTTLGAVRDNYSYSPFGELATYQASYSGSPLLNIQYTRDALGRITGKVETITGTVTTTAYGYDPAGRLTDVTVDETLVAHYEYDGNGNRQSVTRPGSGTVAGTYDAQDRLTSYGALTYSYNANGDLETATSGGETTTYSYDVFGNLTGVSLPNGTQVQYVVDGQNRRIGKAVNGTLVQGFLYGSQLRPVAELDGSGAVVARFVYGTKVNVPEYMIKAGVTYRLLTDHLGSVRLVVNTGTGAIAQRLDYNEFGQITQDTNPGVQPFGFAGGLYDPDTRLTRFGARDYDAFTGRWTTKDPIRFAGGDSELYGYMRNAPVSSSDPLGLWSLKVEIFVGIGAAITVGKDQSGWCFYGVTGVGLGGGLSLDPSGTFPVGPKDFPGLPCPRGTKFGLVGVAGNASISVGPLSAGAEGIEGLGVAPLPDTLRPELSHIERTEPSVTGLPRSGFKVRAGLYGGAIIGGGGF